MNYDSEGLGMSLRFYIPNKLPSEAEAACPRTTLLVERGFR